jgi:hypothetical protein
LGDWFNDLYRISFKTTLVKSEISDPVMRDQIELMLLPVSQEMERVIVAMGLDPYAQESLAL